MGLIVPDHKAGYLLGGGSFGGGTLDSHDIWVYLQKQGFFAPKWMVNIMENPMNKWDDLGG